MPRKLQNLILPIMACIVTLGTAQSVKSEGDPDLTKQPTLYVVGYAHLDTEWRWDYQTTIQEYIPKTMYLNFELFEKYPNYIFNFSGSNRYRMMKEYFPADYEKVKKYVADGRWFPCGSSVEESDVNSPSAESLIRQILYGKQFFIQEFGKTSAEYMLPDCFGFPASLPSILAHAGVKGFSTQKLTWQSATDVGGPDSPEKTPVGIPFNVGIWEGLDGNHVIAALNPGGYGSQITYDLSKSPADSDSINSQERREDRVDWPERIRRNGEVSGLFTDYMYYGTGDTGGSPSESSVKLLEAIVTKSTTVLPPPQRRRRFGEPQAPSPPPGPPVQVGDGPVKVVSATAEQMFLDIKPDQISRLPHYKGDLELTNHSAGSLTSQAYLKRWNRQNEILADAAEKASVTAEWLGGRTYPLQRLNDAWTLVMGGQFHDIIPGTSIPKAYEYSWNDEVLAMNQFAGVLSSAMASVASGMDTRANGTSIVVYNPLNVEREDVVEASISFSDGPPKAVRVIGPDGKETPGQLENGKVLFLASVPSIGYAIYDVQAVDAPSKFSPELKINKSSLENARYIVKLDANGDVASIFDKVINKKLLSAPLHMEIKTDNPEEWPAWNMDWEDQSRSPRAILSGPAKIRIIENGPVRVALQVERETEGSKFIQTIRLAAGGAGNRVEFVNNINWNTKEAHLKAVFPLTASNPNATYNWDIGTIERGTNHEKQFEVASHQWFDLTDKGGSYGVTVLSDCKTGSDKPDDSTLRLTLIRTPGVRGGYQDQASQDLGHHEFIYGLAGHAGDWRQEQTDWQALRLNQPLIAFESPAHSGALGNTLSLLSIDNSRIRVLACKKAEQSDEIVIRLVEMSGKPEANVSLNFISPVAEAREIDGAEMPVGEATVKNGAIVTDFNPYQVRSFAVKLNPAPKKVEAPQSQPVALEYDIATSTRDNEKTLPSFNLAGRSLPAEMLPAKINYSGIRFKLAPAGTGQPDAVTAKGQTIALPEGKFTRLYLLAASADGDQEEIFRIGEKTVDLTIQDWSGYIGQWDNRLWKQVEMAPPPEPAPTDSSREAWRARRFRAWIKEHGPVMIDEYTGLTPGFIKRTPVAWFASHRHKEDGTNEPYAYCYLFANSIDIPEDAKTLTLPDNDKIRIMAITVADQEAPIRPVQPLYDTLKRTDN